MLDRDQVLHVAELARLRLTDEEIEKMRIELSDVLEHVERIRELDLTDVPPTTHVVAVAGPLRPDEPRPSLAVEAVLAAAPERVQGGFGVPSPGAGDE
jgi:aspartyl-tRNA(Asn)/glutamyl-tRNA(Gln) amidotransferase subunit C